MRARRIIATVFSLFLIVSIPLANAQGGNLSSLYEEVFRGSRGLHMPKTLFTQTAVAKPIVTIPLNDKGPFRFEKIQGFYFFPLLTNDDASSLYFNPYYGSGGNSGPTYEVFRYDKRRAELKIDTIMDMVEYRREKLYGFYRSLTSQSDGVVRINTEKDWASVTEGKKPTYFSILNPKDLDAGANLIFLSRFQETESKLPYMGAMRDTEFLVYSRSDKSTLKDFMLPFTGAYLPITVAGVKALQSVVGQNLVFWVLNAGGMDMPVLTVPTEPLRWSVLIYDLKEDALYSVWHGMDESDHLPALSFSYYLGQEGLYFEVLKQGKLEIYRLDIDLKKATPLKEYETVDLLWNNKGLRELWKQRIHEAKSRDPSFQERWE
jgi:hypothetical protein